MTTLDRSWTVRAVCNGLDPELFFSDAQEDILAARALCATCPVKADCLKWATETHQEFGVWGGQLFSESQSPIKHGEYVGYVRGCRRTDCADDGGCAGAKRRYSALARARAKAKKERAAVR